MEPGLLTTVTGGVAVESGPQLRSGARVGEYRVDGLLGAGGMGQVYAVVHPVIGKRAAAKVLHPELSRDHDAVSRFVQEARAVNQIGHPNIVDIFGFGELDDGRAYFVMERLAGESLRTRMEHGRLPLASIVAILGGIAVALEAAHSAGIIHRDLKPDNVFLVGAQQVKLLDFGIAKLVGNLANSPQTSAGRMMGTPAYVSPEQAGGGAVDRRTDVYAFGVVAFEMLTGRLPFAATSALQMITMHMLEPPPAASTLAPEVPAAIDALVSRMMAKNPAERPTLAEAVDTLTASVAVTAVEPPPPQRRVSRPLIAALSAGALGGVVAAIVIAHNSSSVPPPPPPRPPTIAPLVVEAPPAAAPPAPAPPPAAAPAPEPTPPAAEPPKDDPPKAAAKVTAKPNSKHRPRATPAPTPPARHVVDPDAPR